MAAIEFPEMDSYRSHVESLAVRSDGETVFNRSPEHAGVIVEWVFRSSSSIVEILTSQLAEQVYGKPALIDAALEFLARPNSRIEILSENLIERAEHPFLVALDGAGFAERVRLRILPQSVQSHYSFNFAVGDKKNLRYEQLRTSFDALAQFGSENVGMKLHKIFRELSQSVAD